MLNTSVFVRCSCFNVRSLRSEGGCDAKRTGAIGLCDHPHRRVVIASLVGKLVAALLRTIKFNELAQRSGFTDFVHQVGVKTDADGAIAGVTKWFIRLIVLVVAFDALGLLAVSDVLRQLPLWLPNLVVALVVLVAGGLAAQALSELVRAATAKAGFSNPGLLATIARVAVGAFAIVVAVNRLGIATTLINTLLVGIVGALALASGLAFGLAGPGESRGNNREVVCQGETHSAQDGRGSGGKKDSKRCEADYIRKCRGPGAPPDKISSISISALFSAAPTPLSTTRRARRP